jgi:acetyl-CoA carboxylase biotin carboxyl carrier protein
MAARCAPRSRRSDGARRVDDRFELRAPAVGLWRGRPGPGALIEPGSALGELDVLGVLHRLLAPAGAIGIVLAGSAAGERRLGAQPVAYGDVLLWLGEAEAMADQRPTLVETRTRAGALVFPSPLSGRFYARPAPDKPPFVQPGDVVETGRTIALLEVMKTFNRITYGGANLPARAKIVAVLARDEDDVDAGTPLFELAAVG